MNPIDEIISFFSPAAGLSRARARHAAKILAGYDVTKIKRNGSRNARNQSQNSLVELGAVAAREEARHLQRNHDLSRGALRTLVNNVVGPSGIGVEPQPRSSSTGEIHEEYANALSEAWRDFCLKPEVTHRLTFAKCQRLAFASKIRDGECFAQVLMGKVPLLDHGTRVPISIELFEADFVPMHSDEAKNIKQGIRLNAWGRPKSIMVYKSDPRDAVQFFNEKNLKTIPWENILHLVSIDRIGQLRGVSEFASVITRLLDIKDYEESERIAAKIAASLTAYIKKGDGGLYETGENGTASGTDSDDDTSPREINLEAGVIFDDLLPGEDVGMIKSDRPNANLVAWRQGQLKALAAGFGGSYSSISKDYDGNYSSQRQELIEQWVHYAVLSDNFVGEFVSPVYRRFVLAADLSGVVPMPKDVDRKTFDDALFIGQQLPWIDPLKEASAAEKLIANNLASETEMIRKRGQKPSEVLTQRSVFKKKAEALGLVSEESVLETNSDYKAQASE